MSPTSRDDEAIDILGKSDPVIARMAPVNAFVPGHNKWNLDRSIRDGQPDLVLGLPRAPGEVDYLVRLGYRSYPGGCFVRPDSARVGVAQLCGAGWPPCIPTRPRSNDQCRLATAGGVASAVM